jgi:diguanylate cyclase (GGDEF)-like protein
MFDLTSRPVRAGLVLVLVAAGMIGATVWLFPVSTSDSLQACAVAGGMMLAALLCSWWLSGSGVRNALGLFPLIVFVGIAGIGVISRTLGASYGGFYILAFIYVGQRLPARATWPLIFPATGLWLVSNGAFMGASLPAIEVRLPIAMCLWLCVGEFLSAQARVTTRTEAYLQRQADLDPLTELHNRRALAGVFAGARGGDAIVLIDLDHFKAVNDAHGHARGDKTLVDFAGVLSAAVRDRDLVVRYGGEEFMLYLPETTARQADLVLQRVRERWLTQGPLTTFSAGIAQVRSKDDVSLALADADRCLYLAKDSGRDRWLHSEWPTTVLAG